MHEKIDVPPKIDESPLLDNDDITSEYTYSEYTYTEDDKSSPPKAISLSLADINLIMRTELAKLSGMNAYKTLKETKSERLYMTVLKELCKEPSAAMDKAFYIVKGLTILVPQLTDPLITYDTKDSGDDETFSLSIEEPTKTEIRGLLERIDVHLNQLAIEEEAQFRIDKEIRQAKQKTAAQRYARFMSETPPTQQLMLLEAYHKVAKALLIGGMSSASIPYKHWDPMPSFELKLAVQSLHRKHAPRFKDLKLRYEPVHGETPLRFLYNGKDNVFRGAHYSHLRVQKYLEREGMKEAILQGIQKVLEEEEPSDIKYMFAKALDYFESQRRLLNPADILARCVNDLANAFLKLAPLSTEPSDDSFDIMRTIAFLEIAKTIEKKERNELSIADYYKIMALLNLSLMNRLSLEQKESRDSEQYYRIMTSHSGETLVANSGSDALRRSLQALGLMTESFVKLPGFPLEGAIAGMVRKGYYEWSNDNDVNLEDPCALIGRDAETLYDLDIDSTGFKQTLQQIVAWSRSAPSPKLLVVDISLPTIETRDPILVKILELREALLRERCAFDVLVVRSEQKQQSLGTGKFAAGSSFLITEDPERRIKFDMEAKKNRTMDQRLSTFYRENVSPTVAALVGAQVESAKAFAENKHLLVNGPFIIEHIGAPHRPETEEGYSFGFVVRNWTSWEFGQNRIDPGVLPVQRDNVPRIKTMKYW